VPCHSQGLLSGLDKVTYPKSLFQEGLDDVAGKFESTCDRVTDRVTGPDIEIPAAIAGTQGFAGSNIREPELSEMAS
jgi:hypothetical protein